MNKQILKLFEISKKSSRKILGLMSGTSMDGLDIAVCNFSGAGRATHIELEHFGTIEYSSQLQQALSGIAFQDQAELHELTIMHSYLSDLFAAEILDCTNTWGIDTDTIDIIASHGQTVYHAPQSYRFGDELRTATLQIADGDHIAEKTGIITFSDFRQKHTAVGLQGAPLAAIMDELLFRDERKNRVLLNLGGIANITWLPAAVSGGKAVSSDTGPANTLINQACEKYFSQPYDRNGDIARSGKVHKELLKYLLLDPFFRKELPKTTGPEQFNLSWTDHIMESHNFSIDPEELVATLTALTIQSVCRVIDHLSGEKAYEIFVTGGGAYNPVIMHGLQERLSHAEFRDPHDLGFPPEAKEAVLMCFLANEMISGGEWQLGKISLPGSKS